VKGPGILVAVLLGVLLGAQANQFQASHSPTAVGHLNSPSTQSAKSAKPARPSPKHPASASPSTHSRPAAQASPAISPPPRTAQQLPPSQAAAAPLNSPGTPGWLIGIAVILAIGMSLSAVALSLSPAQRK
jgi:hypothetical protein